jgi:hypothetical protein
MVLFDKLLIILYHKVLQRKIIEKRNRKQRFFYQVIHRKDELLKFDL